MASADSAEELVERRVPFRSFDGVRLAGTYSSSVAGPVSSIAVLMHGIGGDRDEHGLFTAIASELAEHGVPSFRFDWRCHGIDAGRPLVELTLSGLLNDIDAAVFTALANCQHYAGRSSTFLIANSFAAGVAMSWASRSSVDIGGLVLLNPVLDYVAEYLYGDGLMIEERLCPSAVRDLDSRGSVAAQHRIFSRAMCNEMWSLAVPEIETGLDYWILHGDRDDSVSIRSSESFVAERQSVELLRVQGAGHGFIDPESGANSAATSTIRRTVSHEIATLVTTSRASGEFLGLRRSGGEPA